MLIDNGKEMGAELALEWRGGELNQLYCFFTQRLIEVVCSDGQNYCAKAKGCEINALYHDCFSQHMNGSQRGARLAQGNICQ